MGFCGQVAIKNARTMLFPKLDGAYNNFRLGSKNLDFFFPLPGCPGPYSPILKARRGGLMFPNNGGFAMEV